MFHICFCTDQDYRERLEIIIKDDFPIYFLYDHLREKEVMDIIQDLFLILEDGFLKDLEHHVHDFFLMTEKGTKSQK